MAPTPLQRWHRRSRTPGRSLVKVQLSLKQIAIWLAVGFIIYLVWRNTTGVSADMGVYLRRVFGVIGEIVQKLGSFLAGLFGGASSSQTPAPATVT